VTRTTLALLAALLARAASAAPPALGALPTGDVEVHADRVTYEAVTGRVLLEGNTVVRRGAITLRARSAEYDPATGEVRAAGGVLLTDPTKVVSADAVRAVMGGDFEAEGVVAFVKGQPVDLSSATNVAEARRKGRNSLSFSTPHLTGTKDGRYHLLGARLTLCDCPGGGPPSWEITSSEADVVPGHRATLKWPVLRIAPPFASKTYPVLILPWLYMPLSDRQSGVLIPIIDSTEASGFSVAVPVFITLGRSADATITPSYAFGRKQSQVESGKPAIRGPGAKLELRWTPSEGSEGRAELSWIHDLDAEPGGESGSRGALTLTHIQRVSDALTVNAGLHLAGDPVWVRDTVADILARSVPYRRSDVLGSWRADSLVTEAVASYNQPLDPVAVGTGTPWDPLGTPWGKLGADKGVSSRFGAASAALVPVAAGPLLLSGHMGVARFGPVHGVGITTNPSIQGGVDVVGRDPVTRADARAEIAAPLLLGRAVTFAPYLRGAALAYAPEYSSSSGTAWGVGGASLETEISRRFGELRHVIAPKLEWRAGSTAKGDPLTVPAYDLYDRSTSTTSLLSATPGPFDQLRVSVATRVDTAKATAFHLEAGQDFDLQAGRWAETFAAAGFATGPVTADAGARFFTVDKRPTPPEPPQPRIPSPLDNLNELNASMGVRDGRGDSLTAGFFSVGPGGSGRLVAGLDPLFDVRAAPIDAAASATLAVRAAVGGGVQLGYDALLPGRATFVPSCVDNAAERRVGALQVQQHTGTLTWDSPCHCFRLVAVFRINDCGGTSYSATIDLARLGGGMLH
jgi:LPS-assembly protein